MKPTFFLKSILSVLLVSCTFTFPQIVGADTSYSVKGVGYGDALNLRKYPGTKSRIIARIPANGSTIKLTGKRVKKGRSTWAQVHWKGKKGWVNKRYITRSSKSASNNGSHRHPKNQCTNSITHTHANGKRTHKHRYSCKNNKQSSNANSHIHPRNKCTRSISHSHPNGKRTHQHRYSCKSGKQARDANAHTHPRKACTRSITHTHPNGKRSHVHRYSCK